MDSLSSLLRSILQEGLKATIFTITTTRPDSNFLDSCVQIIQNGKNERSTRSEFVSKAQGKVIAVVDRTADLVSAADSIVSARFAFGGTSPYAPDLVLVNEFVKKQFLDIILQRSIRYMTGSSSSTNGGSEKRNGRRPQAKSERMEEALKSVQEWKSWKLNVMHSGD